MSCSKSGVFVMATWSEVRIPVPWGFVAAKTSGSITEDPMICVHGDVDNAASFDYLVPLFPQKYYFVCVDLPGHGLSSHYGPGIPYKFIDFVFVLKRVVDYFKWQKISILGHHSGGLLGMCFASCFNDMVVNLIVIDPLVGTSNVHLNEHLRILYKNLTEFEGCENPFDYKSLCSKLQSWRPFPLLLQSEKLLMERNLEVSPYGYQLAIDPRVSVVYHLPNERQYLPILLRPLKCQLLLVMSASVSHHKRAFPVKAFINNFRKNCKKIEYHLLKEDFDMHINKPEKLMEIIYQFLETCESSF